MRSGIGSPQAAYAAAREMLTAADAPTAVFTAQNFVSIGAVRALHELDLHRRVAHVGFDDVELADVRRTRADGRPAGPSPDRSARRATPLRPPRRRDHPAAGRQAAHGPDRTGLGRDPAAVTMRRP